MFRLHKHKSDRLGERLEFKFSSLQAFQVPRGWDKLFLSIISVETGKTIAKSNKTTVRSGTCQWTETLSESVWISQDDASRELEECLIRIVVSMGSARSGILGEVILNLADYMSSWDSGALSMPLKKCNYGTILQVRIQCLNPKTNIREGSASKEATSNFEGLHSSNDDMDIKSDGSDNTFNRSVGSSSSNHLGATYPDEPVNRDTSFSASGSHRSSDSGDSSLGRIHYSPRNSLNGVTYVGRQDSAGSHISAAPVDGLSRSNPSSFNSRASGSSTPNPWQETTVQASVHGFAPLSLRPSDSSKDFLEAAEETIDELRDEVKMWERHSEKLKIDIKALKKECSEKSKRQADLDMELSAAHSERDSLKQEVDQLKASLEEIMSKQTASGTAKVEGMLHVQKELEDEVKFLKESNANLSLQLKKTQEANIEFVSILEELEETVEKQRLEIANLTQESPVTENEGDLRSPTLFDTGAEWGSKLSVKEEEIIKLEKKLSDMHNAQFSIEIKSDQAHPDLLKEIEVLKAKVQELERDCAELTDENLELIFKMKELGKDSKGGKDSLSFSPDEFQYHKSPDNSEYEIDALKSQIYELEKELRRKEMSNEDLTGPSAVHIKELERKCADLELELQYFKDRACDLDVKFRESQVEVEEKMLELTELHQKLESFQATDWGGYDTATERRLEKVESWSAPRILSEINKQLHIALTHARNLGSDGESDVSTESVSATNSPSSADAQNIQAEDVINNFLELNALLRAKFVECKAMLPSTDKGFKHRDVCSTDVQEEPYDSLKEQHPDIEELKSVISLKEKEIDLLRYSKMELEDLISNFQREKDQLEENLATALRESSITSKCLDDVRHDLMVLTSSVDSHASTNKILERKSTELENGKRELELHISELEEENVQLSERIAGLEAQLRHLTNDKESNRLELEDSRSLVIDLKDEISKQQAEMETQKGELKQKLQEAQKRIIEAQEESEFLKRSNSKLQVTVESLIEECSSLQKLTGDLRRQKLELHERSTHLEVELSESQKKNSDFIEKVEFLELKLSSLQNDIAAKEKALIAQLKSMFHEHKDHEEKISQAQTMLNQIDQAKTIEVENLKREIAHLSSQVCSTHDEREKIASDAVIEVSSLRSDKIKLESSLQEAHAKIKFYENELQGLEQESEKKVQGLVDLLNASKQSEEMLMADIERMQRQTEAVKSSEEKFRRMANELELNLRASDYEKEQIVEEISSLKVQLQKIAHLQDEILTLKSSLDEVKFEKVKMEELLQSVSEECEELKTERVSLTEKISIMQKALHDGEDDRRSRIALEEKLLRLEGDLTAKEASYAHEAELKNEINRIKRSNSEYHRKMQCLEEEKDELMRKAQGLVLKKEEYQGVQVFDNSGVETLSSESHEKGMQTQQVLKGMQHSDSDKSERMNNSKLHDRVGRPEGGKAAELESKIHRLENELAEALETNNMYQIQLKAFLAEKLSSQTDVLKKSVSENDMKMNQSSKVSALETELKEMRERYLHMSLQYAEVEAQREELVMKLKSVKKEKRWFS